MGKRAKGVATIGIVFNLKRAGGNDAYEEYDEIETIEALKAEIERCGFKVVLLEQDDCFLKRICSTRVDFVVNIAEGRGISRGRESQVPCILESLSIPYSGSDPVALGVTLDKYLTGTVLQAGGVPVPERFMIRSIRDCASIKRNLFRGGKRFIVKPRWEGSSKGIFSDSVVDGPEKLLQRASLIIERYRQPALVEAFIEGDEITAGVCGNDRPRLLGMMRIRPRSDTGGPFIYSLENKHEWETKILYEPADVLPLKIRGKIEKFAVRAFQVLELRDIARIDFRVDSDGIPKVIDVNPLPGLSPRYSDLPILCRLNGKSYRTLIRDFLATALRRCGFYPTGRRGAAKR